MGWGGNKKNTELNKKGSFKGGLFLTGRRKETLFQHRGKHKPVDSASLRGAVNAKECVLGGG